VAIHLDHVQQALFFDGMKFAVLTETALLISRSISIPFSLVNAKIFLAHSDPPSLQGTLRCYFISCGQPARNSSRRSFRRAVSTTLFRRMPIPRRATPIPALAPVISAHFRTNSPPLAGSMRQSVLHKKSLALFSRAQHGVFEAPAFSLDTLHQAAGPDNSAASKPSPRKITTFLARE